MATITTSEWEIMRVLWTKGRTTSSDIITVLEAKHGWSDSTVKTLLRRLIEKGMVSTERVGRAYQYQVEISENDAYLDELKEVLDRICVTEHAQLLEHLIQDLPMTSGDIQRFQRLLNKKRDDAVEVVNCDCMVGQCRCHNHAEVH